MIINALLRRHFDCIPRYALISIPTSAVVYVTLKNDGHRRLTESLEGN